MENVRKLAAWLFFLLTCCLPLPALAAQNDDSRDRLFLSFAEEATLVDRQWWEGQLEFRDESGFDATILRGVVAFQPWSQVELGGRIGFGDTSSSGPGPDGSGATDLDAWGKYHFGGNGTTEFAAGALVTIPTGDDTAGLGMDAFSLGVFGSLRHHGERFTFTGNVGLRENGDGQFLGSSLVGETSIAVGAGVIIPVNERLSFVGEARIETERFSGFDEDARLLGGINLGAGKRGTFRAAISLGLADGAPDAQLIAGYASSF